LILRIILLQRCLGFSQETACYLAPIYAPIEGPSVFTATTSGLKERASSTCFRPLLDTPNFRRLKKTREHPLSRATTAKGKSFHRIRGEMEPPSMPGFISRMWAGAGLHRRAQPAGPSNRDRKDSFRHTDMQL
jgi:hypothetical protein